MNKGFIVGTRQLTGRTLPVITGELRLRDYLGTMMVRWNINRDHYRVSPGLYINGNPGSGSDIFVTSNYKLSFDALRKNITGVDSWILVLDTKGINVWCAAGKGTFGTRELVSKIKEYSLDTLVTHRRIILPQLGATGVAAHKVKEETGFNVIYGPVRAADIRKFIDDGYRKDRFMSKVNFGLADRIKLIPNDFIYGKYYLLGCAALMILLSFISSQGFKISLQPQSWHALVNVILAYTGGIVLTPALLPFIPARSFALKGLYTGVLIFLIASLSGFIGDNHLHAAGWFLIICTISSFMAMNFTGSSTFTSLSGVKKEMKVAIPLQLISAVSGIALYVISKFV